MDFGSDVRHTVNVFIHGAKRPGTISTLWVMGVTPLRSSSS
jgi:hypothetical protein